MKSKQIAIIALVLSVATTCLFVTVQSAAALECSILPTSICEDAAKPALEDSGMWQLLLFGLNVLTAGVGIVAVGAIAYAGFLYTTAQNNAEQTKKALEMIRNTAIGLLLFAGMFAIVNFLVPGGAFAGAGSSTPPGSSQPAPPKCDPTKPEIPC